MKHSITFSLSRTRAHSRDSSSPKSSFRMTKKTGYVILNVVKNPVRSLGRIINETSIRKFSHEGE